MVLSNAIKNPAMSANDQSSAAPNAELAQEQRIMGALLREVFAMRRQKEAALAKQEEFSLLVPAPVDSAELQPLETAVHDAFVMTTLPGFRHVS